MFICEATPFFRTSALGFTIWAPLLDMASDALPAEPAHGK
jgi:hypothetical protein